MYPMLIKNGNRYSQVISKDTGKLYFPLSSDRHESPRYLKFTDFIFKRDNATCQKCGAKHKLRTHHIIPYRERPDLALDPNNAILLCEDCEEKEHQRYKASKITVAKRVKSY